VDGASSGRVAAIGIGSNSIRLLVAESATGPLPAVERLEVVTGLASYGTSADGEPVLADGAIGETLAGVAGFASHARERGARLVGVIATEAVRAAANRAELTGPLERQLGVPVTVVDGETEARLGWQAASLDYEPGARVGVIDIGGASTELSIGIAGSPEAPDARSLRLGSRTLMHRYALDGPVEPGRLVALVGILGVECGPALRPEHLGPGLETGIVIGGTASVLAAVRPDLVEVRGGVSAPVERGWLARWLESIAPLDIEGRAAAGVPRDRADVIVAGGAILLAALDAWGLRRFYAGRRTILDGFLERIVHGQRV
jgi:exopolyphosphatase / guanosine-5'-triphosphate,3'-diphosphate pyrophosphatase